MKNNLRGRQRQRMSRKLVLLLFGSIVAIATVVTTIVLQTGDVEITRAKDHDNKALHIVEDQFYTNEFELSAPVINPKAAVEAGAMNARALKPVSSTVTPNVH
mgnify:CR=1 FL=1|jgi:hypothetical protein